MESRRTQGTLIPRSCAIPGREPCQSLTAAALSDLRDVPRGSFGVVTYVRADSVDLVGVGAHLSQQKATYFGGFIFINFIYLGILNCVLGILFNKVSVNSRFFLRKPELFFS